jgi:hypothetical protein
MRIDVKRKKERKWGGGFLRDSLLFCRGAIVWEKERKKEKKSFFCFTFAVLVTT